MRLAKVTSNYRNADMRRMYALLSGVNCFSHSGILIVANHLNGLKHHKLKHQETHGYLTNNFESRPLLRFALPPP
jgi:hypothetical protein